MPAPCRSRSGRRSIRSRTAQQLALAVAHGDDEAVADEEQQLADLDHLLGVDVAAVLTTTNSVSP